jgi:hypothetical protein
MSFLIAPKISRTPGPGALILTNNAGRLPDDVTSITAVGLIQNGTVLEFVQDSQDSATFGLWLILYDDDTVSAGEIYKKTAASFAMEFSFVSAPVVIEVQYNRHASFPTDAFIDMDGAYAKNKSAPWKWVLVGGLRYELTIEESVETDVTVTHNLNRQARHIVCFEDADEEGKIKQFPYCPPALHSSNDFILSFRNDRTTYIQYE